MKFVVVDLETTGVSHEKGDRMIQLAYSVLQEGAITHSYDTYVHTNVQIPEFVEHLTGIEQPHLDHAPQVDDVLPILLQELEEAYFVAHNVDFDLAFLNESLEEAGYTAFSGPVIDTVELARLMYPSEESYRLSDLTASMQITHEHPHRAGSDAWASSRLLLQMIEAMSELPPAAIKHLLALEPALKSDLRPLLESLYRKAEVADGLEEYRGIALRTSLERVVEERKPGSFASFLETWEEKAAAAIPSFVSREGQNDMMSFVHRSFSEDKIGLVEAGTGTGKTLAYLLPAVHHAASNNKRVVISTETIQLQEQLLYKEIPVVRTMLSYDFQAALLKGRSHYLCLQKLEQVLEHTLEDSYEITLSKAQLLIWLTKTETGDLEEIQLASLSDRFYRMIASDKDSCAGPECPWFSRCFFQRAARSARQADLVITNHALLFTDVVHGASSMPSYQSLVIDEAHHLKKAAERQYRAQLHYTDGTALFNELPAAEADWKEAAGALRMEWNDLFHALAAAAGRGEGTTDTGDRTKQLHRDGDWEELREVSSRTERGLMRVTEMLRANEEDRLLQEFESLAAALQVFFGEWEESFVYWIERPDKGPKQAVTLTASPADVSDTLADHFFSKKKSVILTSATMTVNQSFSYLIRELGLEDFELAEKLVASPFDWKNQAALFLPTDMPMIQQDGEEVYIEALTHAVYQFSQITNGRMLVLFTSYQMLRRAYQQLTKVMDESYLVIGQGIQSRSRSKLVKMFQQFDHTILLGTSSFWEGVDIPGDDLQMIIMARLPFSPPNDPLFQAKSERLKEKGGSPFMQLALPEAVLRFKQGFGRLIRTESDRGIVMVLDRRIQTARYGKKFIDSLPDVQVETAPLHELELKTKAWLGRGEENE
ncbi:helicase C-terminal domain-containing protein [Alkalicoccus chagannorensis]|uniref:helicase C-terminal domain-containing protein n=1 Tax=Alkalicoccus chagannorensis TaxID=427072 RepID=UPI000405E070|nr:helicase C-terminal domain-containing protein [Alkalicoccus chagannorensis]